MRKVKIVGIIMLLVLVLSGCSIADKNDTESYKYTANGRFKIVSHEKIEDGTTNGEHISILVDNETKIMYLQTEKFQSGYGLALQVMVDKDGKPMLYNGEIK